ncbi:MAG: aspartate kinase [Flavobacteriaceae bacterium]|nr:aspartate kinase [Flavobacteriaceae bacterium]
MRIFKFGGASVKDAASVQNLVKVLRHQGVENTTLVVSAMGKTTNAMEEVVSSYLKAKTSKQPTQEVVTKALAPSRAFHQQVVKELFNGESSDVMVKVNLLLEEISGFLAWNKSLKKAFVYDQVVGYGELLSTIIISAYLTKEKIDNQWIDVRELIKTDQNYRDAKVNWRLTEEQIQQHIGQKQNTLFITQGFLGSDQHNFTTTLGREGSDYTAAILAYALNADAVSIWKDVPGVLNADPRYFEQTELLNQISYREAIELAFYGATVIHPKTLQPLQRKSIPLIVRSFSDLENPGTKVSHGLTLEPMTPCYILKRNQVLLQLATQDFSFMVEEHFSALFQLFAKHRLKVDLIQNSAISFSVCLDNRFEGFQQLLPDLEQEFKVQYQKDVLLYTIRHANEDSTKTVLQKNDKVLVEQRNGETLQLVVKQEA